MRSRKAPTTLHPYGYLKDKFVWSLVSAVGIFCLGAGITTAHGFSSLMAGHQVLDNLGYGLTGRFLILFSGRLVFDIVFGSASHGSLAGRSMRAHVAWPGSTASSCSVLRLSAYRVGRRGGGAGWLQNSTSRVESSPPPPGPLSAPPLTNGMAMMQHERQQSLSDVMQCWRCHSLWKATPSMWRPGR